VGFDLVVHLCSLLLEEPVASVLHSPLSGLTSSDLYRDKVLAMMQERENGMCRGCVYVRGGAGVGEEGACV